jgi:uncharacterized membrane protein
MELTDAIEVVGRAVDVVGVAIIALVAVVMTIQFLYRIAHDTPVSAGYVLLRHGLGRGILLGLEFLIAGDIIRTVAATPTFTSVGVLAIIVLIRTFLSFELELEIEGRWPWQRGSSREQGV